MSPPLDGRGQAGGAPPQRAGQATPDLALEPLAREVSPSGDTVEEVSPPGWPVKTAASRQSLQGDATKKWQVLMALTGLALLVASVYLWWYGQASGNTSESAQSRRMVSASSASRPMSPAAPPSSLPSDMASPELAAVPPSVPPPFNSSISQPSSSDPNLKPSTTEHARSSQPQTQVEVSEVSAAVDSLKWERNEQGLPPTSIHRPLPDPRDVQASAAIQAAYSALATGDMATAKQRYSDVLGSHPRNVDALNALGIIALRKGDRLGAETRFQAALMADPSDAFAESQLVLLANGGDMQAESRARKLAAARPDVAAAHFSLGNLLALQLRWGEAQQAYSQAHAADPDHPDVLFNLAVSLEHLDRRQLASQSYLDALQAAQGRAANFNPELARQRASALIAVAPKAMR